MSSYVRREEGGLDAQTPTHGHVGGECVAVFMGAIALELDRHCPFIGTSRPSRIVATSGR